jgi:PD-(D/E)XK endonuclease
MARSPKARGELTEIRFLLAASSRGLIVAKPWGENLPFDFLVGRGKRWYRVQVKLSAARHWRGFHISSRRADGRRRYTARDIDFLVAYISPTRTWYVIPVRVLRGRKTITVFPRQPVSHSEFERYRNRFNLLR